jgi:YhcH/YjgK/YiaL family protein
MILVPLRHWRRYVALPELRPAFEFLQQHAGGGLEDGRHEIDGPRVCAHAAVTWPMPVSDCQFEAHPNHIDLIYLTAGAELVAYAPEEMLGTPLSYDRIADTAVYGDPQEYVEIQLRPRDLVCVFYPEDGHMTSRKLDGDNPVHKIEIKVATEPLG